MSCDVGHRHSSDLKWLWLWCGAADTALIQPLVWDPPYAAGAAIERDKKKKKKRITLKWKIENEVKWNCQK